MLGFLENPHKGLGMNMKYKAYPTNKEEHAHLKMRQKQNLASAKLSKAEAWFKKILDTTCYKWTRQAQWGVRLFDFWCHKIGVAIEIDGEEHDKKRDFGRDMANYKISGIKVIRVKNFNEHDALKSLEEIRNVETWNERRKRLGLKLLRE